MNTRPETPRSDRAAPDPYPGNGSARQYAGDGNGSTRTTAEQDAASGASIGTLFRELAHEVPSLLTKEVALARTEIRENIRATKQGLAAVSTGGAVAMSGLVILLLAAVYGLSVVMAPWLAALIVGAAALVIGFAMVSAGRKKFDAESLRPDHTMNSLHKDRDAIRGRTQ